ncbi:hypothetical protein E4U21_001473 [Claviceps maximensis]|nr:hypothetical protein E4U21_001473 [Claviceps maximensis]
MPITDIVLMNVTPHPCVCTFVQDLVDGVELTTDDFFDWQTVVTDVYLLRHFLHDAFCGS